MPPPPPEITSAALKKARQLVGWSEEDLAARSGVSVDQIKFHESRPGQLLARRKTINALRKALEGAGIEFVVGIKSEALLRTDAPVKSARIVEN
jgi:ribosome-binding protein aMBF1 (putative translation factor)